MEREYNECERHILDVLNKNKYFIYPMLIDGGFTSGELFAGIKKLVADRILIFVSVPYKQKGTDANILLYTTSEYVAMKEPVEYLQSLGFSKSAAKGYINKLHSNTLYPNTAFALRTTRKKQTLRDIEYKSRIVEYLNKEGAKSIDEVSKYLGVEHYHAKTLLASLTVAKAIRYDSSTRTYISLTNKY